MIRKIFMIIATAVALNACGTTNKLSSDGSANTKQTDEVANTSSASSQLNYIRSVHDNSVYSTNIVAKMDFNLQAMGNDITVDGRLYMRKNECIRIQIVPFGLMEVGRLEFTPDYVLLIDRMHKEYVKASYSELSFLKDNGLDFYMLQSMFWNELFMPNKQSLSDADLQKMTTDMSQKSTRTITYSENKLIFNWLSEVSKKNITKVDATYDKGTKNESTVTTEYTDFVAMGSKQFPSVIKTTFNSKATSTGQMVMQLSLNKITNDDSWDAKSTISDKFTQISAEEFFKRLGSL